MRLFALSPEGSDAFSMSEYSYNDGQGYEEWLDVAESEGGLLQDTIAKGAWNN
jgi:hypothetical protein